MIRRRREIQLALGSPAEQDAENALSLLLGVLAADAKMLGDDTASIALNCRLEALQAFVGEFMAVSWAEAAPTGGAT
jgi:hypothetical protein